MLLLLLLLLKNMYTKERKTTKNVLFAGSVSSVAATFSWRWPVCSVIIDCLARTINVHLWQTQIQHAFTHTRTSFIDNSLDTRITRIAPSWCWGCFKSSVLTLFECKWVTEAWCFSTKAAWHPCVSRCLPYVRCIFCTNEITSIEACSYFSDSTSVRSMRDRILMSHLWKWECVAFRYLYSATSPKCGWRL